MTAFDVLDLLGEGSTATVHRARRRDRPGQIVALKTSRPSDESAVRSLRAEAEALGRIDHPNVVRLIEVFDDGATVALALQLAPGGSLGTALTTRQWTPGEVLGAARDLAAAIAECHRLGVVHGDIATTNVLLAADGSVLLADFGSRAGAAGTPGFVAPEVADGATPSAAADVFGLGKVFEALAAAAPHPSVTAAARAATAHDPGDRPTGQEIVEILDDRGAPVTDAPGAPALHTRPFAPMTLAPATPEPPPPSRPNRTQALGPRVAVAAGAVLVVSGLALLTNRPTAAHADARCTRVAAAAPAGAETIEADVDGDGCPNAIVRVGGVVTIGSDRFVLGAPGDEFIVGDWDCDGDATPAVFRPATGRIAVFDAWPQPGEPAPVPRVSIIERPPAPPIC